MLGKVREAGHGSPANGMSPRAGDAAEIDEKSPFQSVKDAINLFVEAGSPKASTPIARKNSEEGLLQVEAQHHLMVKARLYYTDQFRKAEATKAQAIRELQMANKTLQQLTNNLQALNESKQNSIEATHATKLRAAELDEELARRAQLGNETWKVEVDQERELYKATTAQLIASQEELATLRQDFDTALLAKLTMFQKSEQAQAQMLKDKERESLLLKEVNEVHEKLEHVKLALLQAEEECMKLMAEKEEMLQSHKLAKGKIEKEIEHLREEYEPEETLREKLDETMEAIRDLQEQLDEIQSSDLYAIRKMAVELNSSKRALEEAVAEENSLQKCIDLTKARLEEAKRERSESEKQALQAESIAEAMQADLEESKAELETAMSGCVFIMQSCVEKLLTEAEVAGDEARKTKKSAELLRQEAKAARTTAQAVDEKLKIALKEAEEAKATGKLAEERIHNYPGNDDSTSNKIIRMPVEEFESIKKRIEECKNKADREVATAIANAEAIKAREMGLSEKLEAVLEENEAIQSEIRDALKRAEMAEAAQKLVEKELQKLRQNEQKEAGKPKKK